MTFRGRTTVVGLYECKKGGIPKGVTFVKRLNRVYVVHPSLRTSVGNSTGSKFFYQKYGRYLYRYSSY